MIRKAARVILIMSVIGTGSLWLASGWRWFHFSDGRFVTIHVLHGVLIAVLHRTPGVRATHFACGIKPMKFFPGQFPSLRPFRMWTWNRGDVYTPAHLRVPMSVVFAVAVLPTGLMFLISVWHRIRRIPAGHCRTCRYNLLGNTSGVCPECGTKVEQP